MTVTLTSNFLQNARGLTFVDGGGVTWSFNPNTNSLTATSGGTPGAGSITNTMLATMPADTFKVNATGGVASPTDATVSTVKTMLNLSGTNTGDQTLPSAASPTAKVGLTVVSGSATTFMRSDGAPPIDQSIGLTWTVQQTFQPAGGGGAFGINIVGCLALTGKGNGQIQITPFGSGGVLQSAFQYFQDNNLYIDAPGTGTPTGGSTFLRTGASSATALTLNANQTAAFAAALGVNGASPPAKVTGWGTPAGAAVVATFPATPTLAQCGQAIGEIITALKNFGLFGA